MRTKQASDIRGGALITYQRYERIIQVLKRAKLQTYFFSWACRGHTIKYGKKGLGNTYPSVNRPAYVERANADDRSNDKHRYAR